jgi:hypothetical protein
MIIAYATLDNGHGLVAKIGEYHSIEEIDIMIGMYDDDVIITFEEKND